MINANNQWANLNLDPTISNFFQWNYQAGPYQLLQHQVGLLIDDLSALKQALLNHPHSNQIAIDQPLKYFLQDLINFKTTKNFDLLLVYETMFNLVQKLKIKFATLILSSRYPDQPLIYYNYALDLLTINPHLPTNQLLDALNDQSQIQMFVDQMQTFKTTTNIINLFKSI